MTSRAPSSLWWIVLALALMARPRASRARRLSLAELRALASWAGWSGDDADHAAAIAMRESGGDPSAVNDTRGRAHPPGVVDELSVGLWQINTLAHALPVEWLKNPQNNARTAFGLWSKSGWTPWRLPNSPTR